VMEETATKNALMDQAFTYTLLLTHRSQELQVFVSVRLLSCLSLFILSIFNPLHVTNLFFFFSCSSGGGTETHTCSALNDTVYIILPAHLSLSLVPLVSPAWANGWNPMATTASVDRSSNLPNVGQNRAQTTPERTTASLSPALSSRVCVACVSMNDQSIHPDHPSVGGELNNNPSLFLLPGGGSALFNLNYGLILMMI